MHRKSGCQVSSMLLFHPIWFFPFSWRNQRALFLPFKSPDRLTFVDSDYLNMAKIIILNKVNEDISIQNTVKIQQLLQEREETARPVLCPLVRDENWKRIFASLYLSYWNILIPSSNIHTFLKSMYLKGAQERALNTHCTLGYKIPLSFFKKLGNMLCGLLCRLRNF